MTNNIEKLIKCLGCVCGMDERPDTCPCDFYYGNGCVWNIATEAIAMLKDPDRIKAVRCKDCRYFEPCNAEEGDCSGHCRNYYAPCQNQTVDAWWFCGSAERG